MKTWKRAIRIVLQGLVVWLVPFTISLPFFEQGALKVDIFAFKTLMMLVSSTVGLWLLSRSIAESDRRPHIAGLFIGMVWLAINWALDFAILLPISDMSVLDYLFSTGLRYLHMPVAGFFMGIAVVRCQQEASQNLNSCTERREVNV